MKVLIITAAANEKSGWGRYSSAVIEHLRARGVAVTVFSYPSGCPGPYSFLKNLQASRRAARASDAVHALDGWPFGIYGLAATVGTSKPLFINGIGTYSVAPLHSFIKGFLLRAAYRRAEKIFCISKYVAGELQKAGVMPPKLLTVYMGATPLPVLTAQEQGHYRQEYGIRAAHFPVVLTVGAIKDRKGQLDTLRAVGILEKTYPDILYIAAGSGNSKAYVAHMRAYAQAHGLEDNLRIIEDADDRALSFLYSACTLSALNSISDSRTHHFEGFGLVVLEACQFGKPAVGSSDSGIEDAIQDGVTGFLTKQGDPQDIADKIRQILQRYDFFSANAKIRHADFDWGKTVATYIDFYTKTV